MGTALSKNLSQVMYVAERGVFPFLIIDDALLETCKADFNDVQIKLKLAKLNYEHDLKVYGAKLKDMHVKLVKVQFIVGFLKNEPEYILAHIDFEKFNEAGWKKAEEVTDLTIQMTILIALCLPEPLGGIASMVVPIIGDLIKEGESIAEYQKATATMRHNLSEIATAASQLHTQGEKANQESVLVDNFNDNALKAIGESNWSDIPADKSLRFNEALTSLATATPSTIGAVADELLSAKDSILILKLWNSKEKLQKDIESIR
uniref:Uncharacterized protein n=1 Tax=Attheya septentrionalis TaxID=420275 RepID=A0A7S2U9N5_9STRA|mmetsp:Transcript_1354/g.2422  ORF Transcript_1354/g.2422 Transcript_1354/m.2422 type:complete len:262 (+) Transcript_1354:163-948(+)|eukprot:CAMPEP_0198293394 /NCGR_PEP_ID=MMETSP1449-20131203/16904_1 /TAXON_ID=420275 /ORGANISM="Attheya septentrionalis, Strain CCMP2084" /LENGTH=261 /DNA_ID=CAMNT_0043992953 /DNA_START=90 /DNA_END=875 /DNA_ORIENTATION=+